MSECLCRAIILVANLERAPVVARPTIAQDECFRVSKIEYERKMGNDLVNMLGMKLEDVANSPFVHSLGERPKTELIEDRFYMEVPASGIAFIAGLDGRVMSIQFHAEGYQKYNGFEGDLPEAISFTYDRRTILNCLGLPVASGGGTVIDFFGKVPRWDRFDRESYSLHLQYVDGDGALNLVTLMGADSIPE